MKQNIYVFRWARIYSLFKSSDLIDIYYWPHLFVLFLRELEPSQEYMCILKKKKKNYLLAVWADVADEPPAPAFSGPVLDAVDEQVAQLEHGEQGVLDEQDGGKGLLVLGRPL